MYAIIRGKLFKQICEWVQLQVVLVCLDKPKSKEPSIPPYVTRLQHLLVFQPRTVLASRSTVDKVDGHRWLPWLGKACLDTLHGSGTSPLLQMHIVYTTSSFKSANSEAYYSSIQELPLWIMQKVQSCRVVPGWFCFSKSIRLQVDQQHRRKDDDPLPIIRNRLGHQPSMTFNGSNCYLKQKKGRCIAEKNLLPEPTHHWKLGHQLCDLWCKLELTLPQPSTENLHTMLSGKAFSSH